MGHYASEMGVDIPYDPYSEEAKEARRKDAERYAKLSKEITDSINSCSATWFKKSDDLS